MEEDEPLPADDGSDGKKVIACSEMVADLDLTNPEVLARVDALYARPILMKALQLINGKERQKEKK